MLGEYWIPRDSATGQRVLEGELGGTRRAEDSAADRPLRRGWFVGDKSRRDQLLAAVSRRAGPEHYGEELRESAEEKAQRLIACSLRRKQCQEVDLKRLTKGHPIKVEMCVGRGRKRR